MEEEKNESQEDNENSSESRGVVLVIVLIVIGIFIYFFSRLRNKEDIKVEYILIKGKIEKYETLHNKLLIRVKKISFWGRMTFSLLLLLAEFLCFCFLRCKATDSWNALNNLLLANTVLGFVIFLIIFTLYGSLETYKEIHYYFNIRIERYVFKNFKDIKIEIQKLKTKAKEKEEELKEIEEIEKYLDS